MTHLHLLFLSLRSFGGPCGPPRTLLSLRLQHCLVLLPILKLLQCLKHSPYGLSSGLPLCGPSAWKAGPTLPPDPGTLHALSQGSGPPEGPVDGLRGGGLLFGPLL